MVGVHVVVRVAVIFNEGTSILVACKLDSIRVD